jgi:hypothetical protein
MIEADTSLTNMAMYAGGMAPQVEDRVYAEFFYRPMKNNKQSLEAGRDIYEDRAFIKILIPGDKDNNVVRPVREKDKQRFPRQWQAFENREHQTREGTLLSEWAALPRTQVEELKYFNIHTVEDLANMSDVNVGKIMGGNALKQKAADYIEACRDNAPMERMREENQQLRNELEALKSQVAELSQPKRRSRKKVEDDGEIQVS